MPKCADKFPHYDWLFSTKHYFTNKTSANADQIKNRQTYLLNGSRKVVAFISRFVCAGSDLLLSGLTATGTLWLVGIVFTGKGGKQNL